MTSNSTAPTRSVLLLKSMRREVIGTNADILMDDTAKRSGLWLSKWCKIQHFKILLIFNIYSFIFNICIYSSLLFVQNSTPIFIFNSSICSQNYYPFRNYLSIQQLFLHSSFTAHLYYARKWHTSRVVQWMNRGQRRSASDHWNFEKISTALALSSVMKGSADPTI